MSQKMRRHAAIRAVRSEIRRQGRQPHFYTPEQALRVLDDLLRAEPDLIASQWYDKATDNQVRLFMAEWVRWCRDTIELIQQPITDGAWRAAKVQQ